MLIRGWSGWSHRLWVLERRRKQPKADVQRRQEKPYLTSRDVHKLEVVARTKEQMCRYVELPGWTEDLSLCRAFADLPANARRYVRAVEEALGGLRISWVGVGPGRDDMFVMPGVH